MSCVLNMQKFSLKYKIQTRRQIFTYTKITFNFLIDILQRKFDTFFFIKKRIKNLFIFPEYSFIRIYIYIL
jgi:hypothetical protein